MKDKHIDSLQGCLMDYAYTNETDWKTFNELVEKATAYDSKEVQNAIECDRIEKILIELNKLVSVTTNCIVGIGHSIIVGNYETGIHGECSRNKLEALIKALEWVEGRG